MKTEAQQKRENLRIELDRIGEILKQSTALPDNVRRQLESTYVRLQAIVDLHVVRAPSNEHSIARIAQNLIAEKSVIHQTKAVQWVSKIDRKVGDAHAADPVGLARTLANLLENAAETSPQGGEVELRVELKGERLIFIVADQGPGIPEDQIAQVLRGNHTTKANGHGLGLSGARRFAESNSGSIDFVKTETQFCVLLNLPLADD